MHFGPKINYIDPNERRHTLLPEPQNYRQWEEQNYPKKTWLGMVCRHPSHEFPGHLYISAGQSHTHTCPGCGHQITVRNPITWC